MVRLSTLSRLLACTLLITVSTAVSRGTRQDKESVLLPSRQVPARRLKKGEKSTKGGSSDEQVVSTALPTSALDRTDTLETDGKPLGRLDALETSSTPPTMVERPSNVPSSIPTINPTMILPIPATDSDPSPYPTELDDITIQDSNAPSGAPLVESSMMPSSESSGIYSGSPSSIGLLASKALSNVPTIESSELLSSVPSLESSEIISSVPSTESSEISSLSRMPSTESSEISSVPSIESSELSSSIPSEEGSALTSLSSVPSIESSEISSVPSIESSDLSSSIPSEEGSALTRASLSNMPSTESSEISSVPSIESSELSSSIPSEEGSALTSLSSVPSIESSEILSVPSIESSELSSSIPSEEGSALSDQPTSALDLDSEVPSFLPEVEAVSSRFCTANDPCPICYGDCDEDIDCQGDLVCFQRDPGEPVPGCSGGEMSMSRTDYCVDPYVMSGGTEPAGTTTTGAQTTDTAAKTTTTGPATTTTTSVEAPSPTPAPTAEPKISYAICSPTSPCEKCVGDCNTDSDCVGSLVCFNRDGSEPIPGCSGIDYFKADFCVDP